MFPARVGMNRVSANTDIYMNSVPRSRGDEPRTSCIFCHPRIVFPARVGMNRQGNPRAAALGRVPRSRGDEPLVAFIVIQVLWCSPLAWG